MLPMAATRTTVGAKQTTKFNEKRMTEEESTDSAKERAVEGEVPRMMKLGRTLQSRADFQRADEGFAEDEFISTPYFCIRTTWYDSTGGNRLLQGWALVATPQRTAENGTPASGGPPLTCIVTEEAPGSLLALYRITIICSNCSPRVHSLFRCFLILPIAISTPSSRSSWCLGLGSCLPPYFEALSLRSGPGLSHRDSLLRD